MSRDVVEKKEEKRDSNGIAIVRGGSLRRILAEGADILTAFILAVTIYGLAFQKLFGYETYSSEMASISSSMSSIMVDRSLYAKTTDGSLLIKSDLEAPWCYYYLSKQSDSFQKKWKKDVVKTYYVSCRIESQEKMSQYQYNTEILGLPLTLDGSYENTLFVYDESSSDPLNSDPLFNSSLQENLVRYYAGNIDAYEPKKAYEQASSFFSNIYDTAFSEAVKEEKYKNLVLEYASKMWKRSYLQSAAILSSYLLSAIIVFLLIPLIQWSDLTLGKRVAKLQVNDASGNKPRWYSFLIRGLVQVLSYSFMVPFVGVMSFGFGALEMPLLELGSFTLNLTFFLVAGLLLSLASLILMFVTPEKQSLHDLASLTYVNTSDASKIAEYERKKQKEEKDGKAER